MAISTYKVFLMHKKASTWEKLLDIRSVPDLGGSPEMLETTTLSDPMQTFIAGIQSLNALEFDANYDKTTFTALKALEHKQEDYAVWLGGTEESNVLTPTGSEGKFSCKGELSAYPVGGGVNEVLGMRVTIAPSTPIAFDAE